MTVETDPRYTRLIAHLADIAPARAEGLRAWIDANWNAIQAAPGSGHNHQAWPGGFLDHTLQLLDTADVLLTGLPSVHPLPADVRKDSVKTVLLLHDVEKPFKYTHGLPAGWNKLTYLGEELPKRWGVWLTDAELKAVRHAHGETEDYNPRGRAMDPLGAIVHACDVLSARVWHDQGAPQRCAAAEA